MGTPVTTFDGQYILSNSNVGTSSGTFTVFQYNETSEILEEVYAYTNDTFAFGEIGFYHNPVQGFISEDEDDTTNINDMFLWNFGIPHDEDTVVGQMFGFQLPVNPDDPLAVETVGIEGQYYSQPPPVLSNGGLDMYWSMPESETHCWFGSEGTDVFNGKASKIISEDEFQRELMSAESEPILSSGSNPIVYGTTASNQIYMATNKCKDVEFITLSTSSPIKSNLLLTSDDKFLFYATVEGTLVRLDASNLEELWKVTIGTSVVGDIAITRDGSYVIVADSAGTVRAYLVREIPDTQPPTKSPITRPPVTATPTEQEIIVTEMPTIPAIPPIKTISPTTVSEALAIGADPGFVSPIFNDDDFVFGNAPTAMIVDTNATIAPTMNGTMSYTSENGTEIDEPRTVNFTAPQASSVDPTMSPEIDVVSPAPVTSADKGINAQNNAPNSSDERSSGCKSSMHPSLVLSVLSPIVIFVFFNNL